jgi:hypothetical protein
VRQGRGRRWSSGVVRPPPRRHESNAHRTSPAGLHNTVCTVRIARVPGSGHRVLATTAPRPPGAVDGGVHGRQAATVRHEETTGTLCVKGAQAGGC